MPLPEWPQGVNAFAAPDASTEPFLAPLSTEMEDGNIRRRGRAGDRVRTIKQVVKMTRDDWVNTINDFLYDNRASRVIMPAWNGKEHVRSVVMIIDPVMTPLGLNECQVSMTLRVIREITTLGISGTPTTTGTEGETYVFWRAIGNGGVPGYTFSVASGTLPPGLTLNSETGVLFGTPTTAGSYPGIVIRVTDQQGDTADLDSFTITISPADDGSPIDGSPVVGSP